MTRSLLSHYRKRSLDAGSGDDFTVDTMFATADGTAYCVPSVTLSDGDEITWRMGDGDSTTGNTINYNYAAPGGYPIRFDALPSEVIEIDAGLCGLTEFTTSPYWVNLTKLDLAINEIDVINTYASWEELQYLWVNQNLISYLDTFPEWTELLNLFCSANPNLTALETHPEWTKLKILSLGNSPVGSLETHPEWVALESITCTSCNLNTFEVHREWSLCDNIQCGDNNLSAETIDTLLIEVDASGVEDGFLLYALNPGALDMYRSAEGATAKANLIGKGWTVFVA